MTRLRILVFSTLSLSLAACEAENDASDPASVDSSSMSGMDHNAMGSGMMDSSYSDGRFLDHMVRHHQMAVDMARAVADRGGSADVQAMAQEVIRTQTAEMDTMRAWRGRWFPGEPAATSMSEGGMGMMMGMPTDMHAMRNATGAELDRQFLMGMIPHHAGAVMMASHAQVRSERPEIHDLAATIITAQAREIGEMQAALSSMSPAAPTDTTGR